MKTLFLSSTRFGWRCRKAALLLLALGLAALCALFTPADAQAVQAMVKNQPFPYATGVAMDTLLYASVKAKLIAADTLRARAERQVHGLQKEILITRQAMDNQFRLGQYDAGRADALTVQMNVLQGQLVTASADLRTAQDAQRAILSGLPRRIRKQLTASTATQIALETAGYVRTLQQRKWKWAGAAGGAGLLLGFILAL